MTSQVYYLEQHNFRSHIDSVGDAVLRVTDGSDTSIPGSVVEYFDQEYPSAFQYLTIRRDAVTVQAWWNKNFANGYSSMPRFQAAGSPGYYLFIKGVPVEWTTGRDGDGGAESMVDLVGMLMLKDNPMALQNIQAEREARKGKVVNEHFERYLQRDSAALAHIQAKAAKGRAAKKAAAEEAARRMHEAFKNFRMPGADAAPKAATPSPPDDYALIGSTRSATNDELKRAYHEKVKQNAPDKLAQMDPELQEIATERMKKINGAWERIKKARGM